MQQNHSFNGSEHTSQALRAAPEIAKNRWTSFSKPAAHVDQAKNASWGSLGLFLEGFGRLLGLSWGCRRRSWPALGRSWVFVGRLLNASWALLVASGLPWVPPGWFLQGSGWLRTGFWRALGAVFAAIFEDNALITAGSPAWHSHGHFVLPLQRGGTCAAHGIGAKLAILASKNFCGAPLQRS